MTTAARPTFEPAKAARGKGEGDLSALSKQYSSRDLTAYTKLKVRQTGQGTQQEINSRDLKRELDSKESTNKNYRIWSSSTPNESTFKRMRVDYLATNKLDADEFTSENLNLNEATDSDDSYDDTSELLAELKAIKKERLEDEKTQAEKKRIDNERIRIESIRSGNPLLNYQTIGENFKIKRRWDDDVVFKNCAHGDLKKNEQHFINDTIRSQFHKKFLSKYVK